MKHILIFPALFAMLTIALMTTSCSKGDPAIPSQTVIQNNVNSGTWRITSFVDSGKDETSHFSNYTFTFGNNSVLTSTNGSVTHSGTWNITDSNSADDNPNDLHFNIVFNLNNDFDSLSEDWNFVKQTSTRIELIHVSGGNGGTDYLTFEKS